MKRYGTAPEVGSAATSTAEEPACAPTSGPPPSRTTAAAASSTMIDSCTAPEPIRRISRSAMPIPTPDSDHDLDRPPEVPARSDAEHDDGGDGREECVAVADQILCAAQAMPAATAVWTSGIAEARSPPQRVRSRARVCVTAAPITAREHTAMGAHVPIAARPRLATRAVCTGGAA